MKILICFLFLLSLSFFMGCSLDGGLFSPSDDGGYTEHDPRNRREPTDPNDGKDEPKTENTTLYIPLETGREWQYAVEYVQNSATQDYTVTYKGTEKWNCTLARFSDSTFVFKTQFAGEKIILNNNSTRTFPESSTASVTARIQNGRLVVLQENGSTISPFLGDWLFMLKNQFRVSFSGSSTTQNKILSTATLKYEYKLDKSKGLVTGSVTSITQYDTTTILYHLK